MHEPRYEDCFALVLFGKRIGPFRETRASAMLDALDMGHATRDAQDGRIWLTVPADIGTWRWEPVT